MFHAGIGLQMVKCFSFMSVKVSCSLGFWLESGIFVTQELFVVNECKLPCYEQSSSFQCLCSLLPNPSLDHFMIYLCNSNYDHRLTSDRGNEGLN